jgi:hypothetical protein
MNCTFEEYIEDVKSQLCCNNDLANIDYITYDYTEQQIEDNLEYFKDCLNNNLSGYKALLFFYNYLLEQNPPLEDTTTR